MNIVRTLRRRFARASKVRGAIRLSSQDLDWRRLATAIALVAVALGAAAMLGYVSDELALGARYPDAAQDDGAGAADTSATAGDRYLPVPAPLADERVIAALGPIVNLSCKKGDPPIGSGSAAVSPPSDLGPPIADDDSIAWLDRNATNAALSPIAPLSESDDARDTGVVHATPYASGKTLSAPLCSSRLDVDDLLRRNFLAAGLAPIAALPAPESADCPALLRHTFKKLQTGDNQSMCQFQGKVLLIVNTASYCSYTKQYEGLEAMYHKYKDRGLIIAGFPSNDFGAQEPGSNKQIAEFCRTTYGVQFPMFEKTSVAKLDANPLYAELAAKTGEAPKWNFHKYVVDRSGTPVASFDSDVTPDSPKLVDLIERLLAEKYAANKG